MTLPGLFGNLVNPRSDAGYNTFVHFEVLNNHLVMIQINLIICCRLRGLTCNVYITQRAALASSLVKYIISAYMVK